MHCLEKEGRFTIEDIHKENSQLNLHAISKKKLPEAIGTAPRKDGRYQLKRKVFRKRLNNL